MISEPFKPWWDEARTGPSPTCSACGCLMVRTMHDNIGECVELYGSCCGAGMGEAMTEQEEAVMAANALLDVPYADPDDDLRMLSRQLLRRHEELAQLQAHNKALRGALRENRLGVGMDPDTAVHYRQMSRSSDSYPGEAMRPFPCGHPRTDANTRLKRKHPKPSPMSRVCRTCENARNSGDHMSWYYRAKERLGMPPTVYRRKHGPIPKGERNNGSRQSEETYAESTKQQDRTSVPGF